VSTSRCAGLLPLCLQPSAHHRRLRTAAVMSCSAANHAGGCRHADCRMSARCQGGLFFAPARPHYPVDGRSAAELLERACHAVRPGTVQPGPASDIILVDPAMRELHSLAKTSPKKQHQRFSSSWGDRHGQENSGRAVHRASPARPGSFLSLNCAALSESLVDAELFGTRRAPHRSHAGQAGSSRDRTGRHGFSRRDWRAIPALAGQAASL